MTHGGQPLPPNPQLQVLREHFLLVAAYLLVLSNCSGLHIHAVMLLHYTDSKMDHQPVAQRKETDAKSINAKSETYLSSLKGSALTLGVSIDLGNTVPSAPVNKRKKQTEVGDCWMCYLGAQSAKCSESLTQLNTHIFFFATGFRPP